MLRRVRAPGLQREGLIWTLPPFGEDSGRRYLHRHWEWLWNGDEDVATPFHVGALET
jgi:hypothetical protein